VNGYNHLVSGKLAERREKTMALVKKGKKVEKPGYPSAFVALVEKAATLQTTQKYFEELFGSTKAEIADYVNAENSPVTVNVGEKGSNPKVDGVATVIFSQPERLDNQAAATVVAQLLADGKINASDLGEIISQVNKEALAKVVDSDTLASLIKRDETGEVALQVSVRTAAEYKADVTKRLENTVGTLLNTVKP